MKKSIKAGSLLFAAGMLLASTSALEAQSPDGRWLPFVGCWEAVGADAEGGLLCIEPANGGVQLSNIVNGEVVSSEQLLADGQQRPVNAEGCEGWEAVEFSQDGRRAFTRTEFDCGTDRPRTGTGIMAFTAPNMWVDVRALDVDGEPVSWMQEYLLVGVDRLAEEGVTDPAAELSFAVRSARMAAGAAIDLSDVEESAAVVDARAVETWIVAQRDRFDPSAQDLLRLSEAGVAENVIDAVVAVSYPDDFLVASDGLIEETALAPRPAGYRGYMGYNRGWGSAWGMPYSYGSGYGYGYGYGAGYGYSRYGYNPYGYSPYGYGGYGGYGYGYWGSRPGTVIIDRRDGGGSGSVTRNGYRRIGGSSAGTARPRSGARPSYGTGGSRSGASAGSSGGSRSGGRTAQPRRRSGGESTPAAGSSSGSSRPTAPRRTARPRRRTGG